jgi:hemolysin III
VAIRLRYSQLPTERLPTGELPTGRLPAGHSIKPTLYDSGRGVHYDKPSLRGWLHLVWFEAALVLGTLLLAEAHGPRAITGTAIYVVSVAGLFGTSALYHRGNWGPVWRARLQRLDHAMIFVLIAGTATPVFLLSVPNNPGALSRNTGVAGLALVLHLIWMAAPERLVGATFIALGALGLASIPAVWRSAGATPAVLIILGAVLYATGAIFYHHRYPDLRPAVFGYHEAFHVYVCLAAACQYVAIGVFLL